MLGFRYPNSRREFLRVGGLGLLGLSLPQLLEAKPRVATAKSCILLFLHGLPCLLTIVPQTRQD